MTTHWHVLHCKPRKEELAAEQLQIRRVEVFAPRLRVQPVNPRARKVRPYFPGYIFIRTDLDKTGLSAFRYMPGTNRMVSFDGEPAVVPDGLVEAIRKRVDEINAAGGELLEVIKPGDTVFIHDGPFTGYEAIFDAALPGSERVRVLLSLLQKRQVPVELRAGQIRPQNRS